MIRISRLAIHGGEPIRDSYLSYGRQWIDNNDIDAVTSCLQGDYLTTGPVVGDFEKTVAEYLGVKYAVAVSNGTAALHMACDAAGITSGDEVLVSPLTFVASANCVLYQGGTPVFVDIDKETLNIDINKIEEKITNRTKAIIPVDFTGQPVDLDAIKEIADNYNLIIIEDGAHALGSEYKGSKVGGISDLTEFSFHPVKPVTTGEGGVVTTNNKEFYERMMLFRTHGITRDADKLLNNHGPWYYEQHMLGYNYRLTDIQSALGISQMNRLDLFIEKRRRIAKVYLESLKSIPEIQLPNEPEYSNSGWHIFVIRLKLDMLTTDRKEIFEALRAENIGVNVHYIPVYYQPYYRTLGFENGICPVVEEVYEQLITLPIYPMMDDVDIEDVIKGVNKVINYYKK